MATNQQWDSMHTEVKAREKIKQRKEKRELLHVALWGKCRHATPCSVLRNALAMTGVWWVN